MTLDTSAGIAMDAEIFRNYLTNLVNRFFKILPIRENGENSLDVYLRSLQVELLGCKELILFLQNDPEVLTLASILQYFIDNPDCTVATTKREVFKAISIVGKLKEKYAAGGESDERME
jgi:hypothetical protein